LFLIIFELRFMTQLFSMDTKSSACANLTGP